MRSKWSKAVLLSALMVTALLLPLMTVGLTTTAEPTGGSLAPLYIDNDGYHVILHGKDTMYQEYNVATPEPELEYSPGDNPPIMVGKKIENGAVVAFGGLPTFRGGTGYYGTRGYPDNVRWKEGEFDKLMHRVFQWLKSGATTVLWYEGHGVYHTRSVASYFIDNMVAAPYNYTITGTTSTPITSGLLAGKDILVIPQLQLGAGATGGNPTLLSDTEVEVIENFVKAGGGLLIMEGSDYATYNFYKVQNKILKKFGFLYLLTQGRMKLACTPFARSAD
ncbi:MAG: hypothetical protein AVW06_04455 [Hadesarchaea archaeon DG-33-1]|nr:MAG: hypothetical protein AVW06_04455 [Hadesarchaea archaeon DG-33-1]